MACKCGCGTDKKVEDKKPADPNVKAAEELKKETVETVEKGTVEGE